MEYNKETIKGHELEAVKQKGFSIEGILLQYDEEMGRKYNLNEEEHYNKYPKEYKKLKIKERIENKKENN